MTEPKSPFLPDGLDESLAPVEPIPPTENASPSPDEIYSRMTPKRKGKEVTEADLVEAEAAFEAGIQQLITLTPDEQQSVVNRLIKDYVYGLKIIRHLDQLSALDPLTIARALVKHDQSYCVLLYLEKFPMLHNEIVRGMLEKGEVDDLARCFWKFRGLDHQTARELVVLGKPELIADNLPSFRDLGLDIGQTLVTMGRAESVLNSITSFSSRAQSQLTQEIFHHEHMNDDEGVALGRQVFHDALAGYRLDKIAAWLEAGSLTSQRLAELLPPTADLHHIWQTLSDEQDHWSANQIAEWIERIGDYPPVDAASLAARQERLDEETTHRHERVPRPIDRTRRVVALEIGKFYIREGLVRQIEDMERELTQGRVDPISREWHPPTELPLPVQQLMREVRRGLEAQMHATYLWMREYLVTAVYSELGEQHRLGDRDHDLELPSLHQGTDHPSGHPVDGFLTVATEEEVRLYLLQASARFQRAGWPGDWGGKRWAQIADTCRAMWQNQSSPRQEMRFIDLVFDLEHNTGMVFNKRQDRISRSINRDEYAKFTTDQLLLQDKRDSPDLESLIQHFDYFFRYGEGKDAWDHFREERAFYQRAIDRIQRAPRRPRLGGD